MHNREQYTTDNDSIGDKRHRDDILSGSISANIETDGQTNLSAQKFPLNTA